MSRSIRAWKAYAMLGWAVALVAVARPAAGEDAPAAPPKPAAEKPAVPPKPAIREEAIPDPEAGAHRRLAPGVLTKADPARQTDETFSRHDHLGLVAVNSDYSWAKNVSFRHDVWALDFSYKPLRTIWVDVPQKTGAMEKKLIWYLVYSVTNPGKTMHPVKQEDGTYKVETIAKDVRFVPEFLLYAHETKRAERDKVIPVAMGPIRLREDASRRFYNTAEMIREIKVGETVWGIVTWEDVDPRINRFSVYVKGLTNAYKWDDDQAGYKSGDPLSGRKIGVKTLKLNFWRPGDEYFEDEDLIRVGIPGQPDYTWVYLY